MAPATSATSMTRIVSGTRTSATPPEGTRAFQVPVEFGGITVVDRAFVQRAHGDGYAVHVWTVNDPAEMRMLLSWGVDGIMTAEPIKLERTLCATDASEHVHHTAVTRLNGQAGTFEPFPYESAGLQSLIRRAGATFDKLVDRT